MRTAIYLRVSTAEQGRSGLGLEAQEAQCRAALAVSDDEVAGVFVDVGVSGSVAPEKRPGASAMLNALARHEIDAVIVAKLDRLSRSTIHAAQLIDWFRSHGKNLRALDMGVDLATPQGRFVVQMLSAFAEMELGVMAQRQRDAHAARRARGIAGARGTLKRERPDLVERITGERAAGMTWQAIADGLNRDGVPTLRGGSSWRVSSVQTVAYKRKGKTERQTKPAVLPDVILRRGGKTVTVEVKAGDRVARNDGAANVTKPPEATTFMVRVDPADVDDVAVA